MGCVRISLAFLNVVRNSSGTQRDDGIVEVEVPAGANISVIDAEAKPRPPTGQPAREGSDQAEESQPQIIAGASSVDKLSPQATDGTPSAPVDLGGASLYQEALVSYEKGKFKEAVTLLQAAEKQGHTKAQVLLGVCYLSGVGVDRNVNEAIRLFNSFGIPKYRILGVLTPVVQNVAQTSDGAGETQLGLLYLKGRGVEKDHNRAVAYFQAAASKGDVNAKAHLAFIKLQGRGGLEMDVSEATSTLLALEPLAVEAAYYLGLCYILGLGFPRDYTKAVKALQKAVDSGHIESHVLLAYMYLNGWGVSKSVWEAAKLFMRAAERGHPVAQFYIGIFYRDGLGLSRNEAQAKRWLTLSAEQGETLAIYALAKFKLERDPETDWYEAAEMFVKAATQSNREEMPERFYIDGIARAFHCPTA